MINKVVGEIDDTTKQILEKVANAIRQLSMDAIQKANSGHPGLPLGCAELGAYLWGRQLRYHAKNPRWLNRDRFILSAGHGSMLLYSCLHLAGYGISMEDIKNFRQLHSKTSGHPEYDVDIGVEATTGPLGQGVGNSVGQALGLKLLAEKFNTEEHKIFDSKVFCLCGDGCMMEGVSSEAAALAGHWRLNNLVLLYDNNHICLDGPLSECFSVDVKSFYRSYGWDIYEVSGYDFVALEEVMETVREKQDKPVLIVVDTIIGKGSPNKAGTSKVHGSPLGEEEVRLTKEALGLPEEEFYVPQAVYSFFEQHQARNELLEKEWQEVFDSWKIANPQLSAELAAMEQHTIPDDLEGLLDNLPLKTPMAGRSASQKVAETLASRVPYLYGGSADLSCSDKTWMTQYAMLMANNFSGRNIKYGVREFGMATIASGLAQMGLFVPFCGTFLAFSDYMRSAVRIAAMSDLQVVYQFTHDSILLGEDGPTHQPIEQVMSLRAIPNLQVIRPADNNEVKMAWLAALLYCGPTAIILSRQNLPELSCTRVPYADGMGRGAYIVRDDGAVVDYTIFATGSEVALALDVAAALQQMDKKVKVISMPCWELFEQQDKAYKDTILGGDLGRRISIEAGSELGWHKYIGADGIAICMDSFGLSAPAGELCEEFGFTVESILERVL